MGYCWNQWRRFMLEIGADERRRRECRAPKARVSSAVGARIEAPKALNDTISVSSRSVTF